MGKSHGTVREGCSSCRRSIYGSSSYDQWTLYYGATFALGPIAGPIVGAMGAVTFIGGTVLEVGAGYMGYELFIKPNPRVPGVSPIGK